MCLPEIQLCGTVEFFHLRKGWLVLLPSGFVFKRLGSGDRLGGNGLPRLKDLGSTGIYEMLQDTLNVGMMSEFPRNGN